MAFHGHLQSFKSKLLPLFLEYLVKNNTEVCFILSCRHSSLGQILQCENIYREDQHIACSFALTKVKDSNFDSSVQIMVKDNAGKIRPAFSIVPSSSHGEF